MLKKRKQGFYADSLDRFRKNEYHNKSCSPGPGAYSSGLQTSRKINKYTKSIEKHSAMPSLDESAIKETLSKVLDQIIYIQIGPGSYNASIEPTKPRAKCVPEWSRSRAEKLDYLSKSFDKGGKSPKDESLQKIENEIQENSMKYKELSYHADDPLCLKEHSFFASKVPRFQHDLKKNRKNIERMILKKEIKGDSTAIIIEKHAKNMEIDDDFAEVNSISIKQK